MHFPCWSSGLYYSSLGTNGQNNANAYMRLCVPGSLTCEIGDQDISSGSTISTRVPGVLSLMVYEAGLPVRCSNSLSRSCVMVELSEVFVGIAAVSVLFKPTPLSVMRMRNELPVL